VCQIAGAFLPGALLARCLVNLRHFVYNGPSCVFAQSGSRPDPFPAARAYFNANTLLNLTNEPDFHYDLLKRAMSKEDLHIIYVN